MKTLKLIFDTEDLVLSENLKDKPMQEIAWLMIKNIILSYASAKRGLDEEERRKFYKISDAFDMLLKSKKGNGAILPEEIELEDDWMGFIRKCKRESLLMPDRLSQGVEKLIDEVIYQ